jgi:hypothetical protein
VAVAWESAVRRLADIWTSADAGGTWTKRTSISTQVGRVTVASDSTGTNPVVAAGDIWTSSDAGVSWTDQTAGTSAPNTWFNVASDSTGTRLVAVTADAGDIWTSSDAGKTWAARTQGTSASGLPWFAVASDATGTHLVASPQATDRCTLDSVAVVVWTSPDAGATWTKRTLGTGSSSDELLYAVASDASGANLVVGDVTGIWRSTDFGATWTDDTMGVSSAWVSLASNATGTQIVAISAYKTLSASGVYSQGSIWTR